MAREFTKNMLIMLISIMVGVVIITYFVADIVRRTQIETLTIEHAAEIQNINYRNENFTDHILQGTVKMDSAREIREVGNYYFDFALFWYTNAVSTYNNSIRVNYCNRCITNCTEAMTNYLSSYDKFKISKPYFEKAKDYTDNDKYLELIGYYTSFAQAGINITMLRYNASVLLKKAAENLSLNNMENVTLLITLFNETEMLYAQQVAIYNTYKEQISEYLFFDTIREPH
ncbi:MAG: hypothetical protein QXS02_00925 [Candidatus Thermoplasmatota archaeon]